MHLLTGAFSQYFSKYANMQVCKHLQTGAFSKYQISKLMEYFLLQMIHRQALLILLSTAGSFSLVKVHLQAIPASKLSSVSSSFVCHHKYCSRITSILRQCFDCLILDPVYNNKHFPQPVFLEDCTK